MQPRPLDPNRPWPTARQETNRVLRRIGAIALIQFVLSGLAGVLPGFMMLPLWATAGVVVALYSMQIESYLLRKRAGGA